MSRSQKLLIQYFPEPVLSELAEKHDFDPENKQVLHLLGRGISAFFRYETSKAVPTSRKASRAEPQKAMRYLDKLETSLNNIGFDGFIDLGPILTKCGIKLDNENDNPLRYVTIQSKVLDIGIPMIRRELRRSSRFSNSKMGRPPNQALREFAEYMCQIWLFELNRPFTLDYHQGAGFTPAFHFVKDMMEPFHKTDDKKLVSAMRYVIGKYSTHRK